jgi:5-methylthioadenosine/S-adenosylhomocysteine deaminase
MQVQMSDDGTILIRDALIVSDPATVPFWGWLVIAQGHIAEIGTGEPPRAAFAHVFSGRERAVIAGLVNAHAHSHSSLTRGSAEGRTLDDWIASIEREQMILDDEQAYWGALSTYAEALLSGTTTIVDMCLKPEAALRAAKAIGIRAVIAPYVADGKAFAPTLVETEELLKARSVAGTRSDVWVGLHDLESCSDGQIRAGVALAKRYATGLHLHCAETHANLERTRRRTGRTPVQQLHALGVLGRRTLLAHCVWVDAEDRALLAESGSCVVHCPHANLKLGSGIAPVPALLNEGVSVALGTDGAKANNRLDMFDVMKFASLLHKGVTRDPTVLPPEKVLGMANQAGAAALGLYAGALQPRAPADLTLVRLDRFHLQPAEPATIVTNLVHSARGSDVDAVIVGGEIVVQEGRLVTSDQNEILARAQKIGRALLAR